MKVAITGSTGFIGGYLVRYFANKGWDVIAFGRKKNVDIFDSLLNVEYMSWDINTPLTTKISGIDAFIHSAANLDYEKNLKDLMVDNVLALRNILEFSKGINHFVYISSSSVYQGQSGLLNVETKIKVEDLENSYCHTKYLAEEYIREHFKNHVTLLRPRAVYGDGDRSLVPNILKHQIFKKLILPGNGNVRTSITEINDFVEKTYRVVSKKIYGVYNISTDIDRYESLYKKIARENNLKGIIKIPICFFRILAIFNRNKYNYIVDTFEKDKILISTDFINENK